MKRRGFGWLRHRWWPAGLAVLLGVFYASGALAFPVTINVVDQNGMAVSGFRWMVEVDTTNYIVPGTVQVADSTRLGINKSWSPVAFDTAGNVAKGRVAGTTASVDLPAGKRYFLSVLPDGNPDGSPRYTLSGTQILDGQATATVKVLTEPLPTAQISVLAFHDNFPINNAPDVTEQGLAGFAVQVFDQFGKLAWDVFGNSLGTTYFRNPDGTFVIGPDGAPVVDQMGGGLLTDANGECLVKNLAQGKYGVRVTPRDGGAWVQTATIEGTPGIDTWVKPDEPPSFTEFGFATWHAFIGFVKPFNDLATLPPPGSGEAYGTIRGFVKNQHQSKPPVTVFNTGVAVPEAWVGLNDIQGTGRGIYAAAANPDTGAYTIAGVPPGTYQVVFWDVPLDQIFAFQTVTVPPTGGVVNAGDMLMPAWFGRYRGSVFLDANNNGFRDPGEVGIGNQFVNIRYRDGSMYDRTTNATATAADGSYSFTEVFPFFAWITTELDNKRYIPTGATVVTDDGGVIPPDAGWAMPSENKRNPQVQKTVNVNTGNALSRTQTGKVLSQAMLLYADQDLRIDWGKRLYGANENGGIWGLVSYDSTRAEDDARYAKAEPWQPGVPNVQMNLYLDANQDGVIDSLGHAGPPILADVDNWPLGWRSNPALKGPEDVDRNGNGVFDWGDTVEVTWSSSWSDTLPSDCPGPTEYVTFGGVQYPVPACGEAFHNWNQTRPGVFDGAYSFNTYSPTGLSNSRTRAPLASNMTYIVETAPPPGHEIAKEEDRNVDFGDTWTPSLQGIPPGIPPVCVGDPHVVPNEMTLFPGVAPARAGQTMPLCDRRQILVTAGESYRSDSFVFTEVPKAARVRGTITNDIANTLNLADPNFGEKQSPRWIPVSFRDYLGREVQRTYADMFGGYTGMIPSSFTANVPDPTGFAPQMWQACMNDPGDNPAVPDPWFNPVFNRQCFTFDFWPARMQYLDTPVMSVGAFAASYTNRIDCEFPTGTPRISQVVGGPYAAAAGASIVINSMGNVQVANPNFNSTLPIGPANPVIVTRDYGFGTTTGTIRIGNRTLTVQSWNNAQIIATIPGGTTTGELTITRSNSLVSPVGITFTIGGPAPIMLAAGQTIQSALDAAPIGALIIVPPGVYQENLIIWKPVKLQGSGEGSTVINGYSFEVNEQAAWLAKVTALAAAGDIDLVPGADPTFAEADGAAVSVFGKYDGSWAANARSRVDGFTMTMVQFTGGGVFVNGFATHLDISNNRIANNAGRWGGGVRVGWPNNPNPTTGYQSAGNFNLRIHHNHFNQNGGSISGGGAISLYTGSNNYVVSDNYICGNASAESGAGIYHYGLSNNGTIERNTIIFNEVTFGNSFVAVGEGGGIALVGEPARNVGGSLSPGTGNVLVNRNLIQGNAANRNGGGIGVISANGEDVRLNPLSPANWYRIRITNNMVVNNVAQLAGGALSFIDVARGEVTSNTLAYNDSTGTHRDANTIWNINVTNPQIAGIALSPHTTGLAAAFGTGFEQTYSQVDTLDTILWANRSYLWDGRQNGGMGALVVDFSHTNGYWDRGLIGSAISPLPALVGCMTTTTSPYPNFVTAYRNTYLVSDNPAEGGGGTRYLVLQPLSLQGNYHLKSASPARGAGAPVPNAPPYTTDYDGDPRPVNAPDIGADQFK